MSAKSMLNDILAQLEESVDCIEKSTTNISNESNRIVSELKKSQELAKETQVPVDQLGKVVKFTQSVVDVCSNFNFPESNGSSKNPRDNLNETGNFNNFVSTVEQRAEACEKEIIKLKAIQNALDRIQ